MPILLVASRFPGLCFTCFHCHKGESCGLGLCPLTALRRTGRGVPFSRQLVTMCGTEQGKLCAFQRCPGGGDAIPPRPCGSHPSIGGHWPTTLGSKALPLASRTLCFLVFLPLSSTVPSCLFFPLSCLLTLGNFTDPFFFLQTHFLIFFCFV